ncbi:MAG: hypothetical protein Kow009_01540 [Spirochaetales bacterium]
MKKAKLRKRKKSVLMHGLEILMEALLLATLLLVLLQVFSRYVIQTSLKGLEELARLTLVWGAFLGAGYCSLNGRHIFVSILLEKLPPKGVKIIELLIQIVLLVVGIVMILAGTSFVVKKWVFPDYSTILLFPRSLYWLPVPLCGLITSYAAVRNARKVVTGDENG